MTSVKKSDMHNIVTEANGGGDYWRSHRIIGFQMNGSTRVSDGEGNKNGFWLKNNSMHCRKGRYGHLFVYDDDFIDSTVNITGGV